MAVIMIIGVDELTNLDICAPRPIMPPTPTQSRFSLETIYMPFTCCSLYTCPNPLNTAADNSGAFKREKTWSRHSGLCRV
jgi:hypothetical protein